MKKNLFFFVASAAIALTSCSNEDVVESSSGNAIDFRVAIGSGATSRGVETTHSNLSQFYVTALTLNHNTVYFSNALFTRQGTNNFFQSSEEYPWPGHNKLKFYAYSYYSGLEDGKPKALEASKYGSVHIDEEVQTITFTPQQNVPDQIDLVTAYKQASKEDVKSNGVGLEFNHMLCEIQIMAKSENTEYDFDVMGVRIGCVNKTGTLDLNPRTDETSPWSFPTDDKIDYKVIHEQPITLSSTVTGISAATKTGVGYSMPIPQPLTAWDHVNDKRNSQGGAFLAVLLKITTKATNLQVYPRPANVDGVEVGNSTDKPGYGWACVPISTNWQPGIRYVYTLDFSYGAGQVPPEDPTDPGDDILSGQIGFNVTLNGWANGSQDVGVNMNGHNTTALAAENDDPTE